MIRNAWFIARKDVKFELKDGSTVVWIFVMPMVFFYFIGTITGGSIAGGFGAQTAPLTVVGADEGFLSDQLVMRLEENGFDVAFATRNVTTESDGRRLELPPTFGDGVLAGEAVTLTFVGEEAGLQHDLETLRISRAVYTLLADLVAVAAAGQPPSAAALGALNALPRNVVLDVELAGQRREPPSGFEQAIPGTLVMFTMLVLLSSGAVTLFIERERGHLRRLAAAPLSRGQIVLGKWGGKMALGLVQIAFAMLIGTVLFSMDWGPNLPMVFLVLFGWAAFCASLAVLLANHGRSQGTVAGVGTLVTMILAALGGAWWPIEITPPFMQALQKAIPSGWTMDALHKLISFAEGPLSVLPHLAALLLSALLLGWLGARSFRFL